MTSKILRNKRRGSYMVVAVALTFFFLAAAAALVETMRLNLTAQNVRDAMQAAVVDACTENYSNVYDGVREGYSGGYQLTGGEWKDTVSTGDVYDRLDVSLGTQADGDSRVKLDGQKVDFRLSNLSIKVDNAPFAPDNTVTNQFTFTADIDLEIPLYFGQFSLPSMHTHVSIKATYSEKF